MKSYHPHRADNRTISEKAFGLIYAMDEAELNRLIERLRSQAVKGCKRAKRLTGGAA